MTIPSFHRGDLGRLVLILLVCSCGVSYKSVACHAKEPPIVTLAFSPDGKQVLAGSQRGVSVYSWPSLELQREFTPQFANVHQVAFSPNGHRLAIAGGNPAEDGGVEVYGWPNGEYWKQLRLHEDSAMGVAWLSDELLASVSLDGHAVVSDLGTESTERRLEGHSQGVMAVCFLQEPRLLVTASLDQSLRVWSIAKSKPELVRTLSIHKQAVVDLALRPDQGSFPMVASAGADKTLRLWQPSIGRMVRFARLPSNILDCEWNSEGSRLFAACQDGCVYSVDPESVEILESLTQRAFPSWAYSLAVSPANEIVVGGEDGKLTRIVLPRE